MSNIKMAVRMARRGTVEFIAWIQSLTEQERNDLKQFGIAWEKEQIISDELAAALEEINFG